jgi:hypothetical protein
MSDKRPTIHYTELPPAQAGSPIAQEWETYRREVGRLLAEGHEGRTVLIKGDRIVGLFDTDDEARTAGANMFLLDSYLIQQVRTHEPLYFHLRCYWSCPT